MKEAVFNDGSNLFPNQCITFNRICSSCGNLFEDEDADTCVSCGLPRVRCKNTAMGNEERCRIHAKDRVMSMYNIVAAKVSDSTLEELIEKGNLRDLTVEFALAKLCIADLHSQNVHATERLDALATFFTIAKNLQTIESGGLLNNHWNDPLIVAVRTKFRSLIGCMVDIIAKYVTDAGVRKLMLQELQERSKLIGNSVTIVPHEGNIDNALQLRESNNTKKVDSVDVQ